MDPRQTEKNYDALASWWLEQMKESTYGLAALERALMFVEQGARQALDIGCGCEGRFLKMLMERGFHCAGLDISREMIATAMKRYPTVDFAVGDMCTWPLPRQYDLITAWDSAFHLPLESHEPVLAKLCEGLSQDGVLLLTCGGGEEPGSIQGEFGGKRFEYSSLGIPQFARLLWRFGCAIRHMEYDQYPENHVYIIAKKVSRN
ncbi:MAG: class I SAM-dependent methyltransferase [Nitrospira sp.]|nr:class I SAM-dependent methyltransferase [Nitrospira sp.]